MASASHHTENTLHKVVLKMNIPLMRIQAAGAAADETNNSFKPKPILR